jgi:omega-6 fatty acid desaturase (delta-12 desaturase)
LAFAATIRPTKTTSKHTLKSAAYPTKADLLKTLPPELSKLSPIRAWSSLAMSAGLSALAVGIGTLIPLSAAATPLWLLYGAVTGTIAMGCWVIAHECGHHAFHPNRRIEGVVGFALHSILLVPYYSWAHSHAVHHAHCNHLEKGETHVPPRATSPLGQTTEQLKRNLHPVVFGMISLFNHLVIGWQLYLFFGATGGEDYDSPTSHFWNRKRNTNGKRRLFPETFNKWMVRSNLGLLAMVSFLIAASIQYSPLRVLCIYGLPYMVINMWLTTYTWLQHTNSDIPHFSNETWSWPKGALQTVDRPYGPILNLLHHGIGSTHVCHHINSSIPHYNAWHGTNLLRQRFPELVRYDPTPIHKALWRIATRCGGAVYQNPSSKEFYF